jgi:hypothetical protein
MSEADPQDGDTLIVGLYHLDRNSRLFGRAGTRRKKDGRGTHSTNVLQRDLIIPPDDYLFPELGQVLNEVVCEGIVIIDH